MLYKSYEWCVQGTRREGHLNPVLIFTAYSTESLLIRKTWPVWERIGPGWLDHLSDQISWSNLQEIKRWVRKRTSLSQDTSLDCPVRRKSCSWNLPCFHSFRFVIQAPWWIFSRDTEVKTECPLRGDRQYGRQSGLKISKETGNYRAVARTKKDECRGHRGRETRRGVPQLSPDWGLGGGKEV